GTARELLGRDVRAQPRLPHWRDAGRAEYPVRRRTRAARTPPPDRRRKQSRSDARRTAKGTVMKKGLRRPTNPDNIMMASQQARLTSRNDTYRGHAAPSLHRPAKPDA